MTLQILIAGGGIGGLTAALALARSGAASVAQIDVLEQAPSFGDVGAGVQLGPNVTRRLRALGLHEALDHIASRPKGLRVRRAHDDRELANMPFDIDFRRRYGAPYLCVHRADLHRLLLDAVSQGSPVPIALHSGVQLQRVPLHNGTTVRVEAGDGRSWQGDALIGADGLWSQVRAAVIGGDAAPRATGHMAWRSLVHRTALPQALRWRGIDVWLGARLHAVAYPVRGGEWLNVVVLAEAAPDVARNAQAWDLAASRAGLKQAIGSVASPSLQTLLDAMPGWTAWHLHDRDPLEGPGDMGMGRIALLGDAAHPMLPYLAQGAGMAIEDAVALAQALAPASRAGVPAALGRYADARWARNARVQQRARRNGAVFHSMGPTRVARDLAMRVLGRGLLDQPWLFGG